ncbi:hypothetical protein AXW83_13245 [Bosea sp. PAMC 26642]|nr:hypothetical protein AXW83_13245 [Bosea sp. PAMC 26642]
MAWTQPAALGDLTDLNRCKIVATDNQADAEDSQRAVAGERNWYVDDLNSKHDFLRAGRFQGLSS